MKCFDEKDNRVAFKEMLQKEVIEVEFQKTNGELRLMKCTLKPELIPVNESKTSTLSAEQKDIMDTTALRVFDTEKNEWRSFKWDSVRSIFLQ